MKNKSDNLKSSIRGSKKKEKRKDLRGQEKWTNNSNKSKMNRKDEEKKSENYPKVIKNKNKNLKKQKIKLKSNP